jgi:hypothetical protein
MMDRAQANQILDRHKETRELNYRETTRALRATGDFKTYGGQRVDNPILQEIKRAGDERRFYMVVADLSRYREKEREKSGE